MARLRGASITCALLAVVIGILALFSSPAFTIEWWFSLSGKTWNEWCADCSGAGFEMTCRYLVPGDNYHDYYCEYASYFQYFPEDWDDCNYIAK